MYKVMKIINQYILCNTVKVCEGYDDKHSSDFYVILYSRFCIELS